MTAQTSGSGAASPEFSRPLDPARLRPRGGQDFDVRPDAAENAALTALLGALSISGLRFSGNLAPEGKAGWALEGRLQASVVQACVITSAPVTTRVDQPVRRHFVPAGPATGIDIDPEDDAEIEPLGPVIDLGLIATEELALAIPEYPRAAGAALDPAWSGDDPEEDDSQSRPFDALRALRDRLPE